ncbi:MAG: MFS transporter [Chloroflexi bacterium]|nr:MFS transporter [Chloroflexota bacterium]
MRSHLSRSLRLASPSHFLWRRRFQAFLLSTGLSSTSGAMAGVVFPWIVLQQTGSPAWVGVIIGVPAIIAIGPTFVGGILADRFSKPNVLVATRFLQMAVALLLALAVASDEFVIWYLLVLVILGRVIAAIGFPAASTLVAEVVNIRDLNSANAARNVVGESTEIIGAGLGGIFLGISGPAAAFSVIAVVYGLSALVMLFVSTNPSQVEEIGDQQASNHGFKDAFLYLRASRILQLLFVLVFVDLFTVALFPLLPVYADRVLGVGGAGFGLLMAGLSVGGVAAGAVLVKWGRFINAPKAIVIGNVGWGICMAGIDLSDEPAITLALVVIMGGFGAVTGVAWSSLALKAMPAEMRGRLFSIFNIAFQAFFVGAILTGFIASTLGLSVAMWIGAAGSIIVPAMVWAASPTFRSAEGGKF